MIVVPVLMLRKLHRHQLGRILSNVAYAVREASWNPLYFARFQVDRGWLSPRNLTSQLKIADRNQQVRSVVMMRGHNAAGLQFNFTDPGVVLDEKNVLRSPTEYVEAAIIVPLYRRLLLNLFVL